MKTLVSFVTASLLFLVACCGKKVISDKFLGDIPIDLSSLSPQVNRKFLQVPADVYLTTLGGVPHFNVRVGRPGDSAIEQDGLDSTAKAARFCSFLFLATGKPDESARRYHLDLKFFDKNGNLIASESTQNLVRNDNLVGELVNDFSFRSSLDLRGSNIADVQSCSISFIPSTASSAEFQEGLAISKRLFDQQAK